MKKILLSVMVFVLAALLPAAEKTGPKVFISVDMEGIWGVVQGNQTMSDSPEYGPARKWMAEDVNAVVAGLLEAGAGQIVVNDSHGSMRNILADQINPKVTLISGSPKPLSMMQGIDASFEACLFIGYHAQAGTGAATLDHTISGGTVRSVKINGLELPELGINAAIAGAYNVPVIMLSGDEETCSQAKALLGQGVVTVAVKKAVGRYAAELLPLEEARKNLAQGAREALANKAKVKPFRLDSPCRFELEFLNSGQAEMPSLLPQVKRTGARSVAFSTADYIEGFKLMRAVIALAGIS
jgi:D-amino peptidase